MDGGWISVLSLSYGPELWVVSLRGGVRGLDTQRNLGVRPAEAFLEFDWDVSLTPMEEIHVKDTWNMSLLLSLL